MTAELAGALRERITIETLFDERDLIAGRVQRWRYEGAAWAAIRPIAPGDFHVADSTRFRQRWQVVLRRRDGIGERTRFVWRGRFLAVRAVEQDPAEPSRMVVRCEEQS